MEPSQLIDNRYYSSTAAEIVARNGRSYAEIRFAYCDDGQFRFSLGLQYSYGGFGGPVFAASPAYPTLAAARSAGLESLLAQWPSEHWWEPANAHEELRLMREQVAARLYQPTLFL